MGKVAPIQDTSPDALRRDARELRKAIVWIRGGARLTHINDVPVGLRDTVRTLLEDHADSFSNAAADLRGFREGDWGRRGHDMGLDAEDSLKSIEERLACDVAGDLHKRLIEVQSCLLENTDTQTVRSALVWIREGGGFRHMDDVPELLKEEVGWCIDGQVQRLNLLHAIHPTKAMHAPRAVYELTEIRLGRKARTSGITPTTKQVLDDIESHLKHGVAPELEKTLRETAERSRPPRDSQELSR